ncbi:hypothetical protein [Mesorhizobium sp.]|uniref:hypothetical protein n=1 Tax=Mesorhizobium sp. TaxID=1871066 RepID=UPI000FE38E6D|nr:hypothetical protein [Mesorhizobium sp.]RWN59391.1 MAG: hypothetical protein EOR98_03180 [Mesorhizobium sp.]RWN80896.1 MAG: hypothetical protein EOS02_03170 [Mesorhizobium sp.]RWN83317.1 MAG: hypothetical protein EOS01_03170 [Mesorhizobium sp.]RWN86755.1 MAG: hypothetical protein EOS04_17810 [Mesorhizobium sp.]RWO16390.1 MAG: hypothetical protein EOS15_05205 [Mesorhizobium sp.]
MIARKPVGENLLMSNSIPLLIDQVRDLPKKEKYTTLSVKTGYQPKIFNGIAGILTRQIKVSGVRLIWDEYDTGYDEADPGEISNKLFNMSGSVDIETLEMYADEVVIRSPLVLRQTEVFIFARRLSFELEGSISTVPLPYQQDMAYTATRDANGRPVSFGQVKAAAGIKGVRGGNIWLLLHEDIAVPDRKKRFITCGSKGQDGEDGGYLDYSAAKGQEARPGDQVVRATIGPENVTSSVPSGGGSWRWPAGWEADLRDNRVYHVKVNWYDDRVTTALADRVLPSSKHGQLTHGSVEVGERIWPGGVPDAYPSGKGGAGGDGGDLLTLRSNCTSPVGKTSSLQEIFDDTVSKPGLSKEIPARTPATRTDSGPKPAFLELMIVRKSLPIESPRKPGRSLTTCPIVITPGLGSASVASAAFGNAGKVIQLSSAKLDLTPQMKRQLDQGAGAWLQPWALEAVLHFVSDAYVAGHREVVKPMLEPYIQALKDLPKPLPPELLSQATKIDSLLTRIANNLDYYGNPPGWVPRLSLASNIQLFMSDQKNAVSLIYYAYKLGKTWDKVQDQAQLLKSTSDALYTGIQLAQQKFGQGIQLLESSRSELDRAEQDGRSLQDHLKSLNAKIEKEAEDKAKEQAIFTGICTLGSGLCKVIPVGQPYLGDLGGGIFQLAGKIDINDESASTEAFSFAKGLGDNLQSFVTTNRDKVVADSNDSFSRQLELVQGATKATAEEVIRINGTIANEFDAKTEAYRATLQKEIDNTEKEAASLTGKQEETSQLKARNLRDELALYKAAKMEKTVTQLRKQLAKAGENGLSADEQAKKKALLIEVEGLEAKKAQLEERSDTLTKRKADQEKFLNTALDQTKSIGAGVGDFADGLAKLIKPIDANDPNVKAIKEKLATSAQFKGEFESILTEIDEATDRKRRMLEGVNRAQNELADACATIAGNLTQVAAVGRQLQQMGGALDLDIKMYAKSLYSRSIERLQQSLYHFVKSYEFHYLKKIPSDFFSTNVIDAILRLEEESKKDILEEKEFDQIYQTVFKDKFSALAAGIITDLQHRKPSMENKYVCELQPEHLTALNDTWRFKFNLIDTLNKGSWNDAGSRIISIALKDLHFKSRPAGLSLDFQFTHSGRHNILSKDGYRYYFSMGKYPVIAQSGDPGDVRWVDDDPISWRMVYNEGETEEDKRVTLDENSKDEQLIQFLLREYKDKPDDAPIYREHRPGFSSDVTLTVDGGLDLNHPEDLLQKKSKPFEIDKLHFYVFFERQ